MQRLKFEIFEARPSKTARLVVWGARLQIKTVLGLWLPQFGSTGMQDAHINTLYKFFFLLIFCE